jgi:DNA-binding LytR/AlgR family response regulator
MKVLIVEDEPIAGESLATQIMSCKAGAEVISIIDSVEDSVSFFKSGKQVDLAFFDIQLADGKSFDIFRQVDIDIPVIFTTAYDQFTLQAFKFNSIDYLLKPIDPAELAQAFAQYDKYHNRKPWDDELMEKISRQFQPAYKQRFLLRMGGQFASEATEDIAYFYADGKVTFACLHDNHRRYIVDYALEKLEQQFLNPRHFFRINRKFIININAISRIKTYANGRLRVLTEPPCDLDMIVSRERVSQFKDWLNQ